MVKTITLTLTNAISQCHRTMQKLIQLAIHSVAAAIRLYLMLISKQF